MLTSRRAMQWQKFAAAKLRTHTYRPIGDRKTENNGCLAVRQPEIFRKTNCLKLLGISLNYPSTSKASNLWQFEGGLRVVVS